MWKANTESWYWGYAFQGAVVLGTAPILLPLIADKAGGAAQAGQVVAAFYLGQLLAPMWGSLADRTKRYALVYLSGYVLLALGLGLFPAAHVLGFWLALAFLQGAGAAATNTLAAAFIVEFKPKEEWDGRIGWLQTFYGAGQAVGLGLAAYLQARPEFGLIVSAGLMLPGVVLGQIGLPKVKVQQKAAGITFARHAHRTPHRLSSMLYFYHRPSLQGLKRLVAVWRSLFSLYIVSWFCVMFGQLIVMNLYPLLMREAYGIDARLSSLYYAIAAVVGIFAYAPSGALGKRIGDAWVVMIGILMTLVSAIGMSVLAYTKTGGVAWLAPLSFGLMPVAWSPLIVGGTGLTGKLAPMAEGEAMGIFNATTAIASVLSAIGAGQLAHQFGFGLVPVVAAVIVCGSIALAVPLLATGRPAERDAESPQ